MAHRTPGRYVSIGLRSLAVVAGVLLLVQCVFGTQGMGCGFHRIQLTVDVTDAATGQAIPNASLVAVTCDLDVARKYWSLRGEPTVDDEKNHLDERDQGRKARGRTSASGRGTLEWGQFFCQSDSLWTRITGSNDRSVADLSVEGYCVVSSAGYAASIVDLSKLPVENGREKAPDAHTPDPARVRASVSLRRP